MKSGKSINKRKSHVNPSPLKSSRLRREAGTNRAMAEVTRLRDAMREGRISERADLGKVEGNSRILLWLVNDTLDAVIKPLYATVKAINDIGKGEIPSTTEADFKGDFASMNKGLTSIVNMLDQRASANASGMEDIAEQPPSQMEKSQAGGLRRKIVAMFARFVAAFVMLAFANSVAHSDLITDFAGSVVGVSHQSGVLLPQGIIDKFDRGRTSAREKRHGVTSLSQTVSMCAGVVVHPRLVARPTEPSASRERAA